MRRRVKQVVTVFLTAMVVLVVACDEGMTIRQVKSLHEVPTGGGAPSPQVAIEVETEHPFISEAFYVPRVTITNRFESPITITVSNL
jgi:hypothetical protein